MATKSYSANQARGSEIIPRQRREQVIFLGGLAGTVLLLVIAQLFWN